MPAPAQKVKQTAVFGHSCMQDPGGQTLPFAMVRHYLERQRIGVRMITFVDAETKHRRTTGVIPIHGESGFAGMRKAGRLTAEALDLLVEHVRPGVTTAALDRLAYEFARDHDAIPATLFYKGYRHSTCTTINHVVCNGILDERPRS